MNSVKKFTILSKRIHLSFRRPVAEVLKVVGNKYLREFCWVTELHYKVADIQQHKDVLKHQIFITDYNFAGKKTMLSCCLSTEKLLIKYLV